LRQHRRQLPFVCHAPKAGLKSAGDLAFAAAQLLLQRLRRPLPPTLSVRAFISEQGNAMARLTIIHLHPHPIGQGHKTQRLHGDTVLRQLMQSDDIPQVPMVKEPLPDGNGGSFASSPHQKVTVIGVAIADETNEAGEGKKERGRDKERRHRQPLRLFCDDEEEGLTPSEMPPPSQHPFRAEEEAGFKSNAMAEQIVPSETGVD